MTFLLKSILRFRRLIYKKASDRSYTGYPKINQPALIRKHPNSILIFNENVKLGWPHSIYYYSGYINIRIDEPTGKIVIGENTTINNNAHFYCSSSSITIGKDCLIGPGFYCIESDGHDLNPKARRAGTAKSAPIEIGDNVFIGAHVIVLKGVKIGENSVVAAGSVVTRSFPSNSIIGGNPAGIIKELI